MALKTIRKGILVTPYSHTLQSILINSTREFKRQFYHQDIEFIIKVSDFQSAFSNNVYRDVRRLLSFDKWGWYYRQ